MKEEVLNNIDLSYISELITKKNEPKSIKEIAKNTPMPFKIIRVVPVEKTTQGGEIPKEYLHTSLLGFEYTVRDLKCRFDDSRVNGLCIDREAWALLEK